MHIAIIDNDSSHTKLLQNCIQNESAQWEVDYFHDSIEFGASHLAKYEVIIADNTLPDVSGLTLLRSISKKSSADLALIGTHTVFTEDEVKEKIDDSISNIFDIQNTASIIDWIHYVEAKLRIEKMVETEEESLSSIALAANGHVVNIKDDVAVFGISKSVEPKSREHLIKFLEKAQYKIVVYFLNGAKVNSAQLNVMVRYYKEAENNGGKLVFWNKKQDPFVTKLMHDCTLDKIIKSFDDLDNAVNFVKDKTNW